MGKTVRVVDYTGGIYFVGRDVCTILGYANPNQAMKAHCKGITIQYTLNTSGGPQSYRIISEPDLYRLICGSKLPSAERFEDWIFSEVLPDIRKHGAYLTVEKAEEIINNPDLVIQLAMQVKDARAKSAELQRTVEHQAVQIGILEPKAAFRDAFMESKGNILVRDFATHIKQALKLKSFGQNAMFKWLKDNGYMNCNRYPSARSVSSGWLHVTEGVHYNPVLEQMERHHTTRITPVGQEYFFNKLKEEFAKNANNIQ